MNLRHKILAVTEDEDGEADIDDAKWRIADRYLFAKYELSDEGLLLEKHEPDENFEGPTVFRRIPTR